MAGEEVHVGSGTFRVNPKKALEILSRHQLPDPAMFADLWLRCAEAGRARRIRIDGTESGMQLHFDGRPFSAEDLRDPFSAVFAEASPRQGRLRDLAFGLLAAIRSGARSVSVFSGDGRSGWRLRVESLETWAMEPSSYGGNAIEADWRDAASVPPWRERLRGLPAMMRAAVELDGVEKPALPPPEIHVAFRLGRMRGFLFRNESWLSPNSLLKAHVFGLPVDSLGAEMPAPVIAFFNDDGAVLDASRAGIVRGERLRRVESLVAGRCAELAALIARLHGPRLVQFSAALAGPELEEWGGRLDVVHPGSTFEFVAAGAQTATTTSRWGEIVDSRVEKARALVRQNDWLQSAASGLLRERAADEADPALAALWRAPMFLGAAGDAVSWSQVDEQLKERGCAQFRRRADPAAPPGTVWCPFARDLAWLTRRVGGLVREEG